MAKEKIGHRPQFKPTQKQRGLVEGMAACGTPQKDIAIVVGIDAKTLRKHFREELDTAMIRANAKVAASLYDMATTGKNVAAAIFWTKVRNKWSERHVFDQNIRMEYVGPYKPKRARSFDMGDT